MEIKSPHKRLFPVNHVRMYSMVSLLDPAEVAGTVGMELPTKEDRKESEAAIRRKAHNKRSMVVGVFICRLQ